MKKWLLGIPVLFYCLTANAQYEEIKTLVLMTKLKEAKTEFDKKASNAKFMAKPEAYMLKALIYSTLAADPKAAPADVPQLLVDADAAYKKYKEMDATAKLVDDATYQPAVINIYSTLFNLAYKKYQAKQWSESFNDFKHVDDLSSDLIAHKVLKTAVDTNLLILAGYTAEQANDLDGASTYYSRLANAKVGGDGFENIYRFLVRQNFAKKDLPAFEKYKAIGKELYPKSEYFNYDKVDFAVGLAEDFYGKKKLLDNVLATDPENIKANLVLGQLIFDTINADSKGGVIPSNAKELEPIMITALTKAANGKPDDELPWVILGDHQFNKAIRIGNVKDSVNREIRKKTKPGVQPSKDDAARIAALTKEYGDFVELSREPYEKASTIYAAKNELNANDKRQYRRIAGNLGDVYQNRKDKAKGNAAEVAKCDVQIKKWNDLYDKLK